MKLITKTLATMFLLGSFSVCAATSPDSNKDDGANLGTSETPQIKQQDKKIDKKTTSKKRSTKKYSDSNMMESNKKMDTNNDGMISRDEFMANQEAVYGSFKQNDRGGVDLTEMNNYYMERASEGGLEGKTRSSGDGAVK